MKTEDFTLKSRDGLSLFGRNWQPEDPARAVVCLVHGLGEHCGRYAHVAERFCNAGFALVSMDLRGHGRSEGQRGHSPQYECLMEDLDLLIRQAQERYPHTPVFFYGHSLGGSLVLNYCLRRHPILAGVIASSPGLRPASTPPAWKLMAGKITYSLFPGLSMDNGLDLEGLSHDHRVIEQYRSDPLVHGQLSSRLGMDILTTGTWALEHAGEFDLPLLIIQGKADRLVSFIGTSEFASKVQGDVTYRVWEEGYHELHNEPQKNEVIQVILDWLNGHLGV